MPECGETYCCCGNCLQIVRELGLPTTSITYASPEVIAQHPWLAEILAPPC